MEYYLLKGLYSGIKVILADGGYRGELIENVKTKFGYVIQVVMNLGYYYNQLKLDIKEGVFSLKTTLCFFERIRV